PCSAAFPADTPLFYRHMERHCGARAAYPLVATAGGASRGVWGTRVDSPARSLGWAADLLLRLAAMGALLADARRGWCVWLWRGPLFQRNDLSDPWTGRCVSADAIGARHYRSGGGRRLWRAGAGHRVSAGALSDVLAARGAHLVARRACWLAADSGR